MGRPSAADPTRVVFVRGVLAAFASLGERPHYDHVRRLCGLTQQEVGAYLRAARAVLTPSEPDLTAIVVRRIGRPGPGWGEPQKWQETVAAVHAYWSDRRMLDNTAFERKHQGRPSIPGPRAPSRPRARRTELAGKHRAT